MFDFEVLSILQDCSTVVMVQQHASGAEAGMLQCLPQPSRLFPAGARLCSAMRFHDMFGAQSDAQACAHVFLLFGRQGMPWAGGG